MTQALVAAATKIYRVNPTPLRFHACDDDVRQLMGPYGSGKSVASSMEIYFRACRQAPDAQGIRWTKWAIIRRTYKQLMETTWETFTQWFRPGVAGVWRDQEKTFYLGAIDSRRGVQPGAIVLPDGTKVMAEIVFMALDGPTATQDLESLEITGAWINESRHIDWGHIRTLIGRCGRYTKGGPCTWSGLWMDTNPPEEDSALFNAFENYDYEAMLQLAKDYGLDRAPRFSIFKQPSGLSPQAENLENLKGGKAYYFNMIAAAKAEGKWDRNWENVHVHGQYGFVSTGMPIYADYFDHDFHVSPTELHVDLDRPVIIGMDFGLTPAAVFLQRTASGQWKMLRELVSRNMSMTEFEPLMRARIQSWGWEKAKFIIIGDPAGFKRDDVYKHNVFGYLKGQGWRAEPGEYQDPDIRIASVRAAFQRRIQKEPGLLISPSCKVFIRGAAGGYELERKRTADEEFRDKPKKNEYSHVHDAAQYPISHYDWAMVRGGVSRMIDFTKAIGFYEQKVQQLPATVQMDWAVFDARA